jgi:hypothetical protein
MPLVFTDTEARFEDVCTVEDALPLFEFLTNSEAPQIDLSACTYLHTALLQLLLVAGPRIAAPPADPSLARWVVPLLNPPGVVPAGRDRGSDG